MFALHTTDAEEFLYIEQRERYKSYLSSSIPRVLYYQSYGWFVTDTQIFNKLNKRIYQKQIEGATYIRHREKQLVTIKAKQ